MKYLTKKAKIWTAVALLTAAVVAPIVGAATLNIVNGQLLGASGVDVDGTLYNVEFLDGTCIALFNGCDESTDFTFQSEATADAAGAALMDQVFLDSALGLFDSNPELTAGCSNTFPSCFVMTPYLAYLNDPSAFQNPGVWVVDRLATINLSQEYLPNRGGTNGPYTAVISNDLTSIPGQTWAVWQPVVIVADTDDDGIPDDTDNCPAVANPLQENNDGDMLGDICDSDDDNDGTDDVVDNCPINGNSDQADVDFDGLGDACDSNIDAGNIAQHVENEIAGIVQIFTALNVSGGNGMISKLTGNGGVIKKMSSAISAFEGGYIDLATYVSELDGALSMLTAFDNQIAAKITKGKIVDPDASAIVAASAEIRTTIVNLKVAAGG